MEGNRKQNGTGKRDGVFNGDSIWRTKAREKDEGMMWLVKAGPILRMMSRCQVLRECEREGKGKEACG